MTIRPAAGCDPDRRRSSEESSRGVRPRTATSPATPAKKRTRRGSRGGKNRQARGRRPRGGTRPRPQSREAPRRAWSAAPEPRSAAAAEEASTKENWDYVPMSQWGDDIEPSRFPLHWRRFAGLQARVFHAYELLRDHHPRRQAIPRPRGRAAARRPPARPTTARPSSRASCSSAATAPDLTPSTTVTARVLDHGSARRSGSASTSSAPATRSTPATAAA